MLQPPDPRPADTFPKFCLMTSMAERKSKDLHTTLGAAQYRGGRPGKPVLRAHVRKGLRKMKSFLDLLSRAALLQALDSLDAAAVR